MKVSNNPKGNILVVEDEKSMRLFVCETLKAAGHQVREASNGVDALEQCRDGWPDIIILDLVMPVMDGFEFTTRIKGAGNTASIPIVMLTAYDDRDSRQRGLESGAEDFLGKPIDPTELEVRVRNLLRLKTYTDYLEDSRSVLERQVQLKTTELRGSYLETVFALSRVVEYKDGETANHITRMGFFARTLAEEVGQRKDYCEMLQFVAPMHDVGKVGIPESILLKPGPLTPEETRVISTHCELGARLLATAASPYLRMACEISLSHHENYDGSGYPKGLAGESIPLAGRIVRLCDVYDALRSSRPYKGAMTHEEAVHIILKGDGRTEPAHFDPALLAAFKSCQDSFVRLYSANNRFTPKKNGAPCPQDSGNTT